MAYRAFSDQRYIEKMVRTIEVLHEQETLEVTLLNWPKSPYRNTGHWVKYVSAGSPNKRETFLYWDRKIEDAFLATLWSRLHDERGYFDWMDRYFRRSYRELEKVTDAIFRRGPEYYRTLPLAQLTSEFRRLNRLSKTASAGYYIVYDLMNLLTRAVRREISEVLTEQTAEEQDSTYRQICQVGIRSIVITERIAFLRRLLRLQRFRKTSTVHKKAKAIAFQQWYEFGHSVYDERTNRPATVEAYERRFQRARRLNASQEIAKLRQQANQDGALVRRMLRPLAKRRDTMRHVRWLRTMMGYRNLESLYIHDYWSHAAPLYAAVAERMNIPLKSMWLLSYEEIMGGLRGRVRVKPIIRARIARGFTIKQVGRNIAVLTGVRAEDWHEERVNAVKQLNGMSAYQGKVSGRVRVIRNPVHEGRTFEPGEILVTSMTTPEFVPIIKRAKAIITDEGGMLCHAAIIARELRKPCVIGTKIATQILKDGDRVAVDAVKGIVRKRS